MRRQLAALIGVLFLILIAFSILPVSNPIVLVMGDKLDRDSKRMAGRNAMDCGRVPIGGDAREASNCVLSAVGDKRPFRVRYETTSSDQASAVGLIGARDGHIYHLFFLGGAPDGRVHFFTQSVWVTRCPEPIVFHKQLDWGRDSGMITCLVTDASNLKTN
jgi:hypothetical protein